MESFSLATRSPTGVNFFNRRKNDTVLDTLSQRPEQDTPTTPEDREEGDVTSRTKTTTRSADDRDVIMTDSTSASAGGVTSYAKEGIGDSTEPASSSSSSISSSSSLSVSSVKAASRVEGATDAASGHREGGCSPTSHTPPKTPPSTPPKTAFQTPPSNKDGPSPATGS
ncbi:hypothetical protein EGW08_003225, partial [Elysia chlorotica]